MIEINLLPWRKFKRDKQKKKFIRLFLTLLVVTVCSVLVVNFYVNSLIDRQIQRNRRLKEEVAIFDVQIQEINQLEKKREKLITRMNFVNKLQRTRLLIVHLFDELVKLVPDGVYLSLLQRTNNRVFLQGFSESNNAVSQLMQGIEQNIWMQNPILVEIKKAKLTESNEFRLSFILKSKLTSNLAHEQNKP